MLNFSVALCPDSTRFISTDVRDLSFILNESLRIFVSYEIVDPGCGVNGQSGIAVSGDILQVKSTTTI